MNRKLFDYGGYTFEFFSDGGILYITPLMEFEGNKIVRLFTTSIPLLNGMSETSEVEIDRKGDGEENESS